MSKPQMECERFTDLQSCENYKCYKNCRSHTDNIKVDHSNAV